MKINLRYLAFAVLAISCGTACLQVSRENQQPAPVKLDSHRSKPQPRPANQHGSAEITTSKQERPRPAADESGTSLAALDQFAHDIASGTASPDSVFTALSGEVPFATLEAAVQLLAGEKSISFGNFEALPPSFVAALGAALGRQEDHAAVARALDTAWRDTTDPVARERLENLEIPGLFAARAADLTAGGDTESAGKYLARLENCSHPGTPDALAGLAAQPGIDINSLCDAAWNWAEKFQGLANPENLAARLTDPAFSPEQRVIAAATLAGAAPGTGTVAALDKAAREQPSAQWRTAMENVRDLVADPSQVKP